MIKHCKTCDVPLVPLENWTEGLIKSRTRLCRDCNAEKGRRFFAENKQHVIDTARARRELKREAVRDYWRAHRSANNEACRAREANWRSAAFATIEGRASRMVSRAKVFAKRSGVEFDLTKEWVAERLAAGRCEVTGILFDLGPNPNQCRSNPFQPSLDRIKAGGGYTKDNVRVTVFIFNVARSDFGDEALVTMASALVARNPTFQKG
jgi:hypothetical protein